MIKKLILGTAQFGLNYGINNVYGKPSEQTVGSLLDYARTKGILILDTADAYGDASQIIGRYHQTRQKFSINTKFKKGTSNLSAQLGASMKALNIDYVNVYFFHEFKDFISYPSVRNQLDELKKNGKIKKTGLSVYDNNEFLEAINSEYIDVIQIPFNLLDNYSKRGDLIMLAKKKGKELHVRSVFLQGLFFKKVSNLPLKIRPLGSYLKVLHKLADEINVSIEQLALGYVLQHSEIDNVIIGVDTMDQLKHNIEMIENKISEDIVKKIDKINVKETMLLYPKNW